MNQHTRNRILGRKLRRQISLVDLFFRFRILAAFGLAGGALWHYRAPLAELKDMTATEAMIKLSGPLDPITLALVLAVVVPGIIATLLRKY